MSVVVGVRFVTSRSVCVVEMGGGRETSDGVEGVKRVSTKWRGEEMRNDNGANSRKHRM